MHGCMNMDMLYVNRIDQISLYVSTAFSKRKSCLDRRLCVASTETRSKWVSPVSLLMTTCPLWQIISSKWPLNWDVCILCVQTHSSYYYWRITERTIPPTWCIESFYPSDVAKHVVRCKQSYEKRKYWFFFLALFFQVHLRERREQTLPHYQQLFSGWWRSIHLYRGRRKKLHRALCERYLMTGDTVHKIVSACLRLISLFLSQSLRFWSCVILRIRWQWRETE